MNCTTNINYLEIQIPNWRERERVKPIIIKNILTTKKNKASVKWKGIRSLVTIKTCNRSNITILDKNGFSVTDSIKIADCLNNYFVNVSPNIDNNICTSKNNYFDYLKNIRVNNSFYLRPATYEEVCDIIQSLDVNKSLGPNSLPVLILKICNKFYSTCLLQIINLTFSYF